jgi:Ca2+-binding EF-hand superfamily protein
MPDEVEDKHLELITDVFGQFMTTEDVEKTAEYEEDEGVQIEENMYLPVDNLPDALLALDIDPTEEEFEEIVRTIDPDSIGKIYFEPFAEVISLKLESQNTGSQHNEQVVEALRLFTDGEDREITLQDLQRVAAEVKDNPTLEELREMMMGKQSISLKEFEDIMKQAKAL